MDQQYNDKKVQLTVYAVNLPVKTRALVAFVLGVWTRSFGLTFWLVVLATIGVALFRDLVLVPWLLTRDSDEGAPPRAKTGAVDSDSRIREQLRQEPGAVVIVEPDDMEEDAAA